MIPSRRDFLRAGLAGALLTAGCTRHNLPAWSPPPRRAAVPPIHDEVRLCLIGDWGSGREAQWDVAQACESAAARVGGFHAGVMLGDNFYPWGVAGTDDPLWREYFEEVYDTEHLGLLPWYAVLGNHDHMGNPQAQIDYTAISKGRWNMPHHFYVQEFRATDGTLLLSLVAIDTEAGMAHWDDQLDFMRDTFARLRGTQFIICGHHPFYSNGRHGSSEIAREKALPLIEGSGALAYFAGHDHNLQLVQRPEMMHVISGGGGMNLHPLVRERPGTLFKGRRYGFSTLTMRDGMCRIELRDSLDRLCCDINLYIAR